MPEMFLSKLEQALADWIGDHPGCNGQDIGDAFPECSLRHITGTIESLQTLQMIEWGSEVKSFGWYLCGKF